MAKCKMSYAAKEVCKNIRDPREGLSQKKNGTWELVVRNGDKRKSFSSKYPEQVWEKYAQYIESASGIESTSNEVHEDGPLFETVAEKYREEVLKMKHGTQKSYLPAIDRSINYFGNMRMKEIMPWQIKTFLNNLHMAKTTTSNQKSVINSIFQLYIDDPIWHGDYNPATMTSIPKGLPQQKRITPTDQQIDAVKSVIKDPDKDDLLPIMYLCTGGRRGECCALQLKDFNWDDKIIYINHAVEWINNQPRFTHTKTDAGIRALPLPGILNDALKKYKNMPSDTFIIGLGNKPVTASWYNRHWTSWWRKHGFAKCIVREYTRVRNGRQYKYKQSDWKADVCAHQFRHEYVCMLCEAGVKEEIAIQIIGHANARMVHEVYMHLKPSMLSEAASLLNLHLSNE